MLDADAMMRCHEMPATLFTIRFRCHAADADCLMPIFALYASFFAIFLSRLISEAIYYTPLLMMPPRCLHNDQYISLFEHALARRLRHVTLLL